MVHTIFCDCYNGQWFLDLTPQDLESWVIDWSSCHLVAMSEHIDHGTTPEIE